MALPDGGTLSTSPAVAAYLSPDADVESAVLDWERGGVALNDATQGLDVRDWYAQIVGNDMRVGYSGGPAASTQLTVSGVTQVSLAFDRNMRVNLAYETDAGVAALWWFDAVANDMDTLALTGARSPRLTHDDKRPISDSSADIICTYLVDDELRYRQQRDRYETEYVLETGLPTTVRLRNVGMNAGNRLQWVIG